MTGKEIKWGEGGVDERPQRGFWAPGDYDCTCVKCGSRFTGDKRAVECAPCAYCDGIDARGALKALVDKLKEIGENKSFKGVFSIADIHGFKYTGPTWERELEDAIKVLEEV